MCDLILGISIWVWICGGFLSFDKVMKADEKKLLLNPFIVFFFIMISWPFIATFGIIIGVIIGGGWKK